MSSILKALRKLEDDKSALGEGSVDLGRDILKRSYRRRSETDVRWYLLLGLLVAVLIAGGAWWFSQGKGASAKVETQGSSRSGEHSKQNLSITSPAKVKKVSTIVVPAELRPKLTKPAVANSNSQPRVKKPAQEKKSAGPALIIPELFIAEIAYQADPQARLAVINDLPVMEGTIIEGARVVEILPDRVRFSMQGVLFEKVSAATSN